MAKGHGSEPTMHHADLQFSLLSEFARHSRVIRMCNAGLFYIAWELGRGCQDQLGQAKGRERRLPPPPRSVSISPSEWSQVLIFSTWDDREIY